MKNLILSLFFICTATGISLAQNANQNSTEPKYISVTGSAEMEVIADEIYFTVILQEYLNKEKVKIEISALEKELQNSVDAAGIAKGDLQIENVYGQQWSIKRKKSAEFLARKTYVIKLSEPSKIDMILSKIEDDGIHSVYISRYSHSKIEQFKKELQIKSIISAKEKATYLLAAINEQIGSAKYISEKQSSTMIGGFYMDENKISNNEYKAEELNYSSGSNPLGNKISFKSIKLRFEIDAQFFIK
jgi:uncharacterized protein YggE